MIPRGDLVLPLALAIWAQGAWAQESAAVDPNAELANLQRGFQYGRYEEVLKRAAQRIDRGNLSEQELIELHKYAGLSAFYLKNMQQAQRHLVALSELDPDYALDPFVVPPAAMKYFDQLRKDRAQELNSIREQRRLRSERLQREAEERQRAQRDAEDQRRRLEQLSSRVTVRTVETRSYLVNFIPFGAGQFQQGRNQLGVVFAATEGVLALTSIIAYFAYAAQIRERTTTVDGRVGPSGTFSFTEQGIPADRRSEAAAWRNLKYGAGGAFWLAYVIGVVDALYHHQDQVVSSSVTQPATSPATPAPEPVSNGIGAGLRLSF
jgi:tetratricopeptide (TPR) repeat protein